MMVGMLVVGLSLVSCVAALGGNSITGDEASGPIDCYAERDMGGCSGQEEAWYYLPEEDICHFFIYTGCGGNTNRFSTRDDCHDKCQKLRCPELDCPEHCSRGTTPEGCPYCACTPEEAKFLCLQPKQRGYCRALHHKWAWDPKQRQCNTFVYGGCGGNENNFETEETCLEVCSKVDPVKA